jgi:hypothetical protein
LLESYGEQVEGEEIASSLPLLAMTRGVEGEEYEVEGIATGFALAMTSSDCRVLLLKDSQ